MSAVLDRLRDAGRAVHWYVRGVTGADAYDKYLVWCRRTGHTPMSEREFWADKCDREGRHPGVRCC
ncbi:CstA-like transporter-associated (seleno)protein [Acidipropionibacterium timonense]|uniref:CstA-like transporter-associated (seleno)protein n=1 Tax=Acidipropionibacterium timonense TaxID=2161818 RepID=UPI00102FE40A|nr:YbdD/YjiX family protein [Acidipropionibacterium timonense]